MTNAPGNRPAEIFGFPAANASDDARDVRGNHYPPIGGW